MEKKISKTPNPNLVSKNQFVPRKSNLETVQQNSNNAKIIIITWDMSLPSIMATATETATTTAAMATNSALHSGIKGNLFWSILNILKYLFSFAGSLKQSNQKKKSENNSK